MNSYAIAARRYAEGMGEAVANRTVNRVVNGHREEWADVAERVAMGNALLAPDKDDVFPEFHRLHAHLRKATILMSGRHLQHGDVTQPSRPMEVMTNCSTAAASFLSFYLLLNGSGVGRAYDDAMMAVDWYQMPQVFVTIAADYPDRQRADFPKDIKTWEEIDALLPEGTNVKLFVVEDSREGWAKAVEELELRAYNQERGLVLVFDFSRVRPHGSPIRGMQNRPSSGPGATMQALIKIAELRDREDLDRWEQAMHVDHYLAESVLVGGARRAARMATKNWRDREVFGFIRIKAKGPNGEWPELWSSNNSVTVDEEFWAYNRYNDEELLGQEATGYRRVDWDLVPHARAVLERVCWHSYHDGSGEPGLINQDKLHVDMEGIDTVLDGDFAGSARFKPWTDTKPLLRELAQRFAQSDYKMITNPCGEITLTKLGGYCVIADVVPYFADSIDDAEDAFRTTVRALIRTNLMDCLYAKEVKRTNRIGVGFTGIHEFAWKFFKFGFRDLINEEKAKPFWLTMARFSRAVKREAQLYSLELGVNVPHTDTTVKPAGTTSKLFGLSEGAHLPAMREYLRYVQFRNDDPLVERYRKAGYPVKDLTSYSGTTVVGFPTVPEVCTLGMGDELVTASEATPEEQYQWLRLLEKYWIQGVSAAEQWPLIDTGNQVSYTLKYDPNVVSYEQFVRTLLEGQSSVRCCSVMPAGDTSAYEYQPETPVSRGEFDNIVASIRWGEREEVGFEHVDCASGACPVSFNEGELEEPAPPPSEKTNLHTSHWVVFGKSGCAPCEAARNLLTEHGIEFSYLSVVVEDNMELLRSFGDYRSVPVVVRDNEVIGGLQELTGYLKNQ